MNALKLIAPTILGAVALGLGITAASAQGVVGTVWTDANQNGRIDGSDQPVAGVIVTVENSAKTFIQTATTGAGGTFAIPVPPELLPDVFVCYLDIATLPPGSVIAIPASGMHDLVLDDIEPDKVVEADFLLEAESKEQPGECPKLTGGGWIIGTPSGEKANFGVQAGIRRGAFWGGLNYIDHGTGMHVKSRTVTSVTFDPEDADCLIITYDVTIDGEPGQAIVRACDKGEPGRDDIFEIELSNGYVAGGDLGGTRPGGGNIQLHKCPPGWTR